MRRYPRYLEVWEPLIGREAAQAKQRPTRYLALSVIVGYSGAAIFTIGFVFHASVLGWIIRSVGLAIAIVGGFALTIAAQVARRHFRQVLGDHFGVPLSKFTPLPLRPDRFQEWRAKWVDSRVGRPG